MSFVPGGGGGALAHRNRLRRRYGAADKALLDALAARCDGRLVKGALHATHAGVAFRVRPLDGSKRFVVSVVCEDAGRFRMSPATAFDRWAASVLPSWPLPSRDTSFDRAVCVQTRDREVTARVIHDAAARRTIRGLLEGTGRSLVLGDARLKLFVPRQALPKDVPQEEVLDLVARLATLAHHVDAAARGREVRRAPKHDTAKLAAWTVPAVLLVVGLGTLLASEKLYPLRDGSELVWLTLGGAVLALPFVFLGLAHLVSLRTAPGRLLLPVALCTLVSLPLAAVGGVRVANAVLDHGEGTFRSRPVTGTRIKKSDKSTRHLVGVDAWWIDDETRWFRVSRDLYREVRGGGDWLVEFVERPGALGAPWLQGVEVVRAP